MAQAIVNKLLHGPTARLRTEAAGDDGAATLPEAAAELFGLEPGATPPGRARAGEP